MNIKNKLIYIVAILIVILLAVVYFKSDSKTGGKNISLMQSGKNLEIATTTDVEYYKGAKGYFARPKGEGEYPGVIMIHENRGLRPEIKQSAEELAREGYLVLAVDLLGGVAEDQDGARVLTAKFDQATGTQNMIAGVDFLKKNGAKKIASLGWCFGGRQSVELAISGTPLDATVVYYGGRMATSTERLAPIEWPVLGVFGDQDQSIPLSMVEDFRTSLETLGIRNEIYIYEGVGHAFANPSGDNYAPDETKDAWAKTLAFFEKYLKGKYSQSEIGLEFQYPNSANNAYVVDERIPADLGELVRVIILHREEDLKNPPPVGGEGAPVITISVLNNEKNQSPSIWLNDPSNSQYSNSNLMIGEEKEAVVGGANAVMYKSDGLYPSQNYIVAHGDLIYVITGQYLEENSQIYRDFQPIVDSIKFIP